MSKSTSESRKLATADITQTMGGGGLGWAWGEGQGWGAWGWGPAGRVVEGVATLDGRAHSPARGGRRAAPPTGGRIKAEPGSRGARGLLEGLPAAGAPGRPRKERTGTGPGTTGKMLRERTVRLQYGSRVEAVYVLGTYLWTDVYR